jgi:hypothetical protein
MIRKPFEHRGLRNGLGVIVLNATFNDISVILWWSVLLEEKPEYPGKAIDLHCKSLTNFIT